MTQGSKAPAPDEARELAAKLLSAFGAFMSRRGGPDASPARRAEHRGLWLLLDDADADGQGLRVVDLCARLGVKPPTVTRAVDALERRGLVVRAVDPEDRRSVRVRLSQAGLEFAEAARSRALEHLAGLVDRLGPEDARTLATLLERSAEYFSESHARCRGKENHPSC